ncbi:MAG: flagellar assembly protein FliX [Acetobacterales bacterium]
MKVSRLNNSGSAPLRRSGKTERGEGGDFRARVDKTAGGAGEAAAGVSGADALSPLASILAAQEVGGPTDGGPNGRGRARAEAILDRLEELRDGILTGQVSRGGLEDIHKLVSSRRETVSDPRLAGILDEIDLRAQVELAKLEVAGKL